MEKEYARAMDYYRKGLSIDELQDNRPAIAQDLAMIAELYVEMDNSLEAERFLKRAETIARQINALPELASISFDLGLLYKKNGQKNKAREYLRQAQEIYRNIDTPDARAVQRALLTIDNQ